MIEVAKSGRDDMGPSRRQGMVIYPASWQGARRRDSYCPPSLTMNNELNNEQHVSLSHSHY